MEQCHEALDELRGTSARLRAILRWSVLGGSRTCVPGQAPWNPYPAVFFAHFMPSSSATTLARRAPRGRGRPSGSGHGDTRLSYRRRRMSAGVSTARCALMGGIAHLSQCSSARRATTTHQIQDLTRDGLNVHLCGRESCRAAFGHPFRAECHDRPGGAFSSSRRRAISRQASGRHRWRSARCGAA